MNDADIGSAARSLVVAWLTWHEEIDRRERSSELEGRVEGHRIVNGGQVDADGSWEITDAETGELLAQGVGHESFDGEWQDSWMHIDAIGGEAQRAAREPEGNFGLPSGLAKVLTDWVVDRPDEALQFIQS